MHAMGLRRILKRRMLMSAATVALVGATTISGLAAAKSASETGGRVLCAILMDLEPGTMDGVIAGR